MQLCTGNLAAPFLWKYWSLSQVLLGPGDVQVLLEERTEFQSDVNYVPVQPKPQSVGRLPRQNSGEEEQDAEVERNKDGWDGGIQIAIQIRNEKCLWVTKGRWRLLKAQFRLGIPALCL